MDHRPRPWNHDADTSEWPVPVHLPRPAGRVPPSRAWVGWLMLGTLTIVGSMWLYARILRTS